MKTIIPAHRSSVQKEIDIISAERLAKINLNKLTTLPLLCDSKLLPFLAYSFGVEIEGLNEKEARNILQNAFSIHFFAGTKYTLKTALESIFSATKITEWFEYGGEPYHFRVDVDANSGVNDDIYKKIDAAIKKYKNIRSVLEAIRVFLSTEGDMYFASIATAGEALTLYPYFPTDINMNASVFFLATTHIVETINIKPREG